MTYIKFKKEIKKASKQQKEDKLTAYIAYTDREHLISNFMPITGLTDNQLIKAETDGLLVRDWDTLVVV